MSSSCIKINFDISILNDITYSKNIKSDKVCWFCEKKCYDFVSICKNCKYEKFIKNKKK